MNTIQQNGFILVVDSLKDIPTIFAAFPLVESADYLSEKYRAPRSIKIYNLCSHKRRLSTGYYVSLLAEARKQRAIPEAKTLHQLERNTLARDAMDDLQNLVDKSFNRISATRFTLSVYFGENLAKTHNKLAKQLYSLFPSPLVRYEFQKKTNWKLVSVHHLGLHQVPEEHIPFVHQRLNTILEKPWRTTRKQSKHFAYDLAILANADEAHPPSNEEALKKFCKAAERHSMRAEIISPKDLPRLLEFDALFIRETTRLDNHTFRFALKGQQADMPVIDDPQSIRRCCNKVFLNEVMKHGKVPTPQATLLTRSNCDELARSFQYPIIIKIPDGSFSIGVYKAKSKDELLELTKELFATSSILLAQEFLPTDFDWRIGIVDGIPLYACRYYMSKGHWQIYNHSVTTKDKEGDSDCVPLNEVPQVVLETALKATSLIGNGLYGVDIKHIGDKALIIEVNDNPSIDSGVEDELIGDSLYDTIIKTLFNRIEAQRHRTVPAQPQRSTSS